MKTFKKFIFLTIAPVVFIAILSVFVSRSFENISINRINTFVVGYFTIISFCYVYVFERQINKRKNVLLAYLFSSTCILILTFVFSVYNGLYWLGVYNLKVAVFQSTLALAIFLTINFVSEIYKKSIATKEILIVREKPLFFLKLILATLLLQTVFIFILTLETPWNDLNVNKVSTILTKILLFNLQITLVSFIILAIFYTLNFFKKNIAISLFLASVVSSFINAILSDFMGRNTYMAFLNILLICLFSCSIIVLTLIHRAKIKNLSLSFSKKETEYLQLKNQVNPHFLFNNLNTLIAFIETNPKKAIEFGQHLSNIYRHYLKNESDDFVLLSTEIDFIKEYVAVFKAKFESGFDFKIENEAGENQYVLSLCLQEIIDNVFKHNRLDEENPLEFKIIIFPAELVIRNTKLAKDVNHSTKIGLENINKRYKLLTQKEILIADTTDFFEVKLPLIHLLK